MFRKKWILYIIAAFVIGYFFIDEHLHNEPPTASLLETELVSFDGQHWHLSMFKEKPIVVNFWATWCTPCLTELPIFVELSERFREQVVFVGVAIDSPAKEVQEYLEKFNLRYPIAQTPMTTLEKWKANSLPATYLLNSKGELHWSSNHTISKSDLERAILSLPDVHFNQPQ